MRRLLCASVLTLTACGCVSAGQRQTAGPESTTTGDDRSFGEYAAAHGIRTLNGGGGEASEVAADGLQLEHVDKDRPVKLDGVLAEWPPLTRADVDVRGADPKTQMKVGLQYDEAKLYVAADVTQSSFLAGQDHVEIVLAIPRSAGAYANYDLALYAGRPGESEGSVRLGNRGSVAGAKIVEAPTGTGYSIEAAIPWGSFAGARTTRVGIHGLARYVHGETVIATGPGDPQHPATMPWIPSEPELSMIEQLLTPKGLAKTAPIADLVADLTGDGTIERIAVFERYLTICGPSYLGGTGFFFRDLGGELISLQVRDVTGRGKRDVVVVRRVSVGDGSRDYLEVLTAMDNKSEPRVTFTHEVLVRQSDRQVDNAVRFSRGEIDVSVRPATGWDPSSYKEPTAMDAEPILLPWGAVRSQAYRWDGSRFAKAKQVLQKEQAPIATAVAAGTEPDDAKQEASPPEPPTPKVVHGGDLAAEVLDAYRRDRGVPAGVRPKTDLQVQVAGDDRPERVLLIGRDIVVLGPGFKEGRGYAYSTLAQFADAQDIKDLSARDITGDGDADLVVRGVRRVGAGRTAVDSDVMFVYDVSGETISRIFAIESAREQAGKRVQGMVQFVPSPGGRSFDVLASPGRAFGWTSRTYPWGQDPPGSDTEPLLLPWEGPASVRYVWNGSRFVKSGGD
jgi:cellulose/xylan binding protein with CBM9 domain